MQCQQANALFSDYVERALDPALTVSVDNHLVVCPSCREEVAGIRRVWTQLDQMPVQEPPVALRADILSALDTHLAAENRSAVMAHGSGLRWDVRSFFRPRVLAYAATLLILAVGSLEVVQTQRATLGPLGLIAQAISSHFHPQSATMLPAPMVTATHSEWTANPNGGGTLTVRLKATAALMQSGATTYRADLVADSTAAIQGHATPVLASAEGRFSSTQEVTVSLPLEHDLQNTNLALRITLDPALSKGPNGPLVSTQRPQVVVPLKMADR